jgi:hypothetical protein
MQGVMIGGCDSVTQCGSGTHGVNGRFRRNSLLANTALILLRYIRRVLVHPSARRKLFRSQTHDHILPELRIALTLSLTKSNKRITTKKQLDKV